MEVTAKQVALPAHRMIALVSLIIIGLESENPLFGHVFWGLELCTKGGEGQLQPLYLIGIDLNDSFLQKRLCDF